MLQVLLTTHSRTQRTSTDEPLYRILESQEFLASVPLKTDCGFYAWYRFIYTTDTAC